MAIFDDVIKGNQENLRLVRRLLRRLSHLKTEKMQKRMPINPKERKRQSQQY